jgi:nonsense-mediated mRNA decay protein 3
MQPSDTGMCIDCVRGQIDISVAIPKQYSVTHCHECNRYQRSTGQWAVCELESRELLAVLLKKLRLPSTLKLVDASFIWTEPNSKRLRIKVTLQKDLQQGGGAIQQDVNLEFIVVFLQCDDCKRTYTPHLFNATVQIRQKSVTKSKRMLFFLEQLIIKHNAHEKIMAVKQVTEGLDFHFGHRSHGQKFVDFVSSMFPATVKLSKHLISHNSNNNTYNYKYAFQLELASINREDLVFLPKDASNKLGGASKLVLCQKVTQTVHLWDFAKAQVIAVSSQEYWKVPFSSVADKSQLIEFLVLGVDESVIELCRMDKVGQMNEALTVPRRSTMLDIQCGDQVMCYDLRAVNVSDEIGDLGLDVVIVRRLHASNKIGSGKKTRNWVLKTLVKEKEAMDEDDDEEKELFKDELEQDPEMRKDINIYRRPGAPLDSFDDDVIEIEELLEGLTLQNLEQIN